MKKNILTLMAALLVSAVSFVGCTGGDGSNVANDKPLYWAGDACPITGNKYDSAIPDADGNVDGDLWINFTHEGKEYEFAAWDAAAVSTYKTDKEKYIAIIVANVD